MTRPFEGVKILDFTQVLAGPYASYQLALLGADVIKVERREGEDMRRTPLSREWADRGLAPGWQAINGNKRSLTLDLSKPEAIAIVKQLAGLADVVMENFTPGTMDRLGIGWGALSKTNASLIMASTSGFGQTGPYRERPALDIRPMWCPRADPTFVMTCLSQGLYGSSRSSIRRAIRSVSWMFVPCGARMSMTARSGSPSGKNSVPLPILA